jgi:hypothetical protein
MVAPCNVRSPSLPSMKERRPCQDPDNDDGRWLAPRRVLRAGLRAPYCGTRMATVAQWATAIGVFVGVIQLWLTRRNFRSQFEARFVERYEAIMTHVSTARGASGGAGGDGDLQVPVQAARHHRSNRPHRRRLSAARLLSMPGRALPSPDIARHRRIWSGSVRRQARTIPSPMSRHSELRDSGLAHLLGQPSVRPRSAQIADSGAPPHRSRQCRGRCLSADRARRQPASSCSAGQRPRRERRLWRARETKHRSWVGSTDASSSRRFRAARTTARRSPMPTLARGARR